MALHNDVFKQQIWGFLCDDLESCLAVSQIVQFFPKNTIFKGGLNFTAALAIFSVIELAAGYTIPARKPRLVPWQISSVTERPRWKTS